MTASPAIANSVNLGDVEDIKISLDQTKLDTSVPAEQRFEKLKRVAERKCDSSARSLEAQRFEKACALELKRSILVQVGDDALKSTKPWWRVGSAAESRHHRINGGGGGPVFKNGNYGKAYFDIFQKDKVQHRKND